MNIIHLGLFSNRNPILFPLAGGEDHVGLGPETLSAGKIFDLPRLSQAIQHSVPDWQDVKEGRFDLPWDRVDYNWHDDDELLGCWSIFQTFNAAKTPLDREMPHFLHLGKSMFPCAEHSVNETDYFSMLSQTFNTQPYRQQSS